MNNTTKYIIENDSFLKAFILDETEENIIIESITTDNKTLNQHNKKVFYYGIVENCTKLNFKETEFNIVASDQIKLFNSLITTTTTEDNTMFQGLKITFL